MEVRHVFALVLLACGVAVLLLAGLALLVLPGPYARVHALSPATSLALPLVCLALALDTGPGRQALKLLFIGLLGALSGPVTTLAIGRTAWRASAPGEEPPS
ncbi:cation:proton antiporter [Streptomyces hoynatensis]|uniref:Sodium:proton antiporter n=1 Tax=Streptomyces hoynatensis TaxID=1141874 RepID=A0A3A9YY48_9ACTN|nr:monovalent cation/H(+) antiporter subunit G [Streptomyces hoynatensis]RKN40845.1 hypothetical protein D7294_17375 [Streptomyces hoynatensis]